MANTRSGLGPPLGNSPNEGSLKTALGAGAGTGRLRPIAFSTDAVEAKHRFDAWCAEFGSFNEIALPHEDRAGFEARCAAWRLGAFTVTASATPAMRMLRGPRHAARDSLDHWVLRVARTGIVRTRLGESRFETQARQPVLYSVADGFEGEWSAAEWVTLWIRRDALPGLSTGLSAHPPGPQTGVAAALLADMLLSLPEHLGHAEATDEAALAEAIGSMVSACLLGGGTEARVVNQAEWVPPTGNPLVRERVRRVIRDNIRSVRLTPERIARAAGVSRTTLYRMMEAEGGVASHVQRVRLALVHTAIGDPARAARPIGALAQEHGFHDASAFSRAFRRQYDCTPSDVRAASLRGSRVLPAVGGAGTYREGGNTLATLLRSQGMPSAG